MAAPIVVVAGAPRCGSTLLMRMLYMGGLEVVANLGRISFEDARAAAVPLSATFLRDCQGRAVKILDPHRHQLMEGFAYEVLWLHRDPDQQAQSQLKFLRDVGGMPVQADRRTRRAIARSIVEDYQAFQRLRAGLSCHRILELHFERLLTAPNTCAVRIVEFLERPLDRLRMAEVVIPRPPTCLAGFLELSMTDAVRSA